MRDIGHIFCCLLVLSIIQGCSKTDVYEEKTRTLDSLSGALNSMVRELEKIDTISLKKYVTRFTHYRQFIRRSINDTISKSDADNLRHFYISGENLENFERNRRVMLSRADLINSQLLKLTADIKKRAMDADQITRHTSHEKKEAGKLMEAAHHQQRMFYSGMEEFKNSLRGVELLIRSRNNGELPTIIKDTLSL